MGIKVLQPDVNESVLRFAAVGTDVRFGMGAVRNVGENVVAGIVQARTAEGHYTDFNDFLRKVPVAVCNKRVIESLIKAGAFDSLGHDRKGLLMVHEQGVETVIDIKRNEAIGQDSLFGAIEDDAGTGADTSFDVTVPTGEWDKTILLTFEREMLGLYVSSHPLDGAERILERNRDCSIAELMDSGGPSGYQATVKVAGIISAVDKKVTKQGNTWALVTLEDQDASLEVAFFPATYQLYATFLERDVVVSVTGRVRKQESRNGDSEGGEETTVSLSAQEVEPLDISTVQTNGQTPVLISIREDRINDALAAELKRILQAHPGNAPVHLRMDRIGRKSTLINLTWFSVDPNSSFMGDIKSLLGSTSIST
jgi:DNA polymerase-3 subunit alpha